MREIKVERLKEVVRMAYQLGWIFPEQTIKNNKEKDFYSSYPLMILSEVEKCMLAMVDDEEFARMNKWCAEPPENL